MLDTLTLVELRELPLLPEPRPAIKEKMLAVAALIDVPLDITPHRTGILPEGCWWLPQARLILFGSACGRPLLLNEVRTICSGTGLSGLLVRECCVPAARTHYSLDAFHAGRWHARHLLWISEGGSGWLIPDVGSDATYLRLSQWGLDGTGEAPFRKPDERSTGLIRGDDYLASFVRRR